MSVIFQKAPILKTDKPLMDAVAPVMIKDGG